MGSRRPAVTLLRPGLRLLGRTVGRQRPTQARDYGDVAVNDADAGQGADVTGDDGLTTHPSRRRRAFGVGLGIAVVGAVSTVVVHDRKSFVDSLHQLGVWPLVASFACGVAGVAASFGMWREVLRGLGVDIPWRVGSRVFFASQLGKYLPGSVWPVVMQMEAGRSRGANRRTMLSANLIVVVMSCSVGLLVACLLLPLHDAHALVRYWWALLALPILVALLHPRDSCDYRSGLRARSPGAAP